MRAEAIARRLRGGGGRVVASALDPLVSSGTMFLVQGAVLLSASKLEFAAYSLAYSYVVMGQAVLSALFGGPLVTLLAGAPDAEREAMGAAVLRLQLIAAVVLGMIGVGAAVALGLPAGVAVLAAAGMIGLSFRDALRNVLAAALRLDRALGMAIVFAAATIAALAAAWLARGRIGPELALAALAFGALAGVAPAALRALAQRATLPREAFRRLTSMVKWSLPGVAAIWLQNSFYLTLVAVNLSLGAAGEVSAARMVAMPILIVSSGLLRLTQVQAARRLQNRPRAAVIGRVRALALVCLAAGAVLGGGCWMADGLIDRAWLPNDFPHLIILAGAWLAFAAASTARGLYTSIYQAMGRYRELFVQNVVVLPFVLAGIAWAPLALGLVGAVLPMALGEVALLALLAARAARAARPTTHYLTTRCPTSSSSART